MDYTPQRIVSHFNQEIFRLIHAMEILNDKIGNVTEDTKRSAIWRDALVTVTKSCAKRFTQLTKIAEKL